jgi:soluble P-type ATPase
VITIEVAGRAPLQINDVVLDVDGTLTCDGRIIPDVKERLERLRQQVELHLLTVDAYANHARIEAELGLSVAIIRQGSAEKGGYVLALGADHVAAVGNGADDAAMLNAAAVRIAVMGPEGTAAALLGASDVLARDVTEALDMLLYPRRLAATLRR